MMEKASISPIDLVEKTDCSQVQPARRFKSSSPVIPFFRRSTPVEDEERPDTWIPFAEPFEGPALAPFNTKTGLAKLNRDEGSDRIEDAVGCETHWLGEGHGRNFGSIMTLRGGLGWLKQLTSA